MSYQQEPLLTDVLAPESEKPPRTFAHSNPYLIDIITGLAFVAQFSIQWWGIWETKANATFNDVKGNITDPLELQGSQDNINQTSMFISLTLTWVSSLFLHQLLTWLSGTWYTCKQGYGKLLDSEATEIEELKKEVQYWKDNYQRVVKKYQESSNQNNNNNNNNDNNDDDNNNNEIIENAQKKTFCDYRYLCNFLFCVQWGIVKASSMIFAVSSIYHIWTKGNDVYNYAQGNNVNAFNTTLNQFQHDLLSPLVNPFNTANIFWTFMLAQISLVMELIYYGIHSRYILERTAENFKTVFQPAINKILSNSLPLIGTIALCATTQGGKANQVYQADKWVSIGIITTLVFETVSAVYKIVPIMKNTFAKRDKANLQERRNFMTKNCKKWLLPASGHILAALTTFMLGTWMSYGLYSAVNVNTPNSNLPNSQMNDYQHDIYSKHILNGSESASTGSLSYTLFFTAAYYLLRNLARLSFFRYEDKYGCACFWKAKSIGNNDNVAEQKIVTENNKDEKIINVSNTKEENDEYTNEFQM